MDPRHNRYEGKYQLNCEWDDCQEVFSKMENFSEHVSCHLQVLLNATLADANDFMICHWRHCGQQLPADFDKFTRHSLYHTFHTKLKSIALLVKKASKLEHNCMLDRASVNLIPDLPEQFICGWKDCKYVSNQPDMFYMHVPLHVSNMLEGNNVPGGCPCCWEGCTNKYPSRFKLRDHLRSHTQEKVVACADCGALFSNNTRFLDHIRKQIADPNQQFQCSHCDKVFSYERLLRDHMRRHVNHYKCPLCDMTCGTPSGVRIHMTHRHTEERPFTCQYCDYTAKIESDIRRHETRKHQLVQGQLMDKTMYQCDEEGCDYQCIGLKTINKHIKEHHDQVNNHYFKCHLCPRQYKRGKKLTAHLKSAHSFKEPPGHVRFRYLLHEDGFNYLQTLRYESMELTQQILGHQTDEPQTEEIQGNNGEMMQNQQQVPQAGQMLNSNDEMILGQQQTSQTGEMLDNNGEMMLGQQVSQTGEVLNNNVATMQDQQQAPQSGGILSSNGEMTLIQQAAQSSEILNNGEIMLGQQSSQTGEILNNNGAMMHDKEYGTGLSNVGTDQSNLELLGSVALDESGGRTHVSQEIDTDNSQQIISNRVMSNLTLLGNVALDAYGQPQMPQQKESENIQPPSLKRRHPDELSTEYNDGFYTRELLADENDCYGGYMHTEPQRNPVSQLSVKPTGPLEFHSDMFRNSEDKETGVVKSAENGAENCAVKKQKVNSKKNGKKVRRKIGKKK